MVLCRPQTQDQHVHDEVFVRNEYKLPDRFEQGDLVIDIGAHVGMVAIACLERGAEVWSYEPDIENFVVLEENIEVAFYRRGTPHKAYNLAVWKPGVKYVSFTGYPEGFSACGSMVPGLAVGKQHQRRAVRATCLDDIVAQASRPVRLLKIDAEAAEYAILYSAKPETIACVKALAIEVHEPWTTDGVVRAGYEEYTGAGLKRFLEASGFDARIEWAKKTQLLFAKRP